MATMRLLAGLASFAAMFAFAPSGRAQVEIERFEPALDADGFLGVQGTRTPEHGGTSYALITHYGSSLLAVEQAGSGELQLVEHRLAGMLALQGGLGSRLALAMSAPFVLRQAGEELAGAGPALASSAFGDPRVHLRYRFLGDAGDPQRKRQDGPGMALQLDTALPAGEAGAFAAEGEVRMHARLLADLHLLGAGIGASLGLRHRFEARRLFDLRVRDEFTFGVGLRSPVPPLHPLVALLELRGATDFRSSKTTALELTAGLQLPVSQVTFVLGAGPGLSAGFGTPGVRVLLGVYFAPADADTDGDGIADDGDGCPPLPEDLDGFQDEDGCPDPDNDNDLVPDVDDLCPTVEALEGRDDDEDGCTDE
jgi:hypothetical protein